MILNAIHYLAAFPVEIHGAVIVGGFLALAAGFATLGTDR
jgi:hypothetical protein